MIVSGYDEHMDYDTSSDDGNDVLFVPEVCSSDSDVHDSTKALKGMNITAL